MKTRTLGVMNVRFLFAHVVLPIFFGTVIYTLWRASSLEVFNWYRLMGLSDAVASWRVGAESVSSFLPFWLLYSLPDGLWVYAVTAFCGAVWADSSRFAFLSWSSIGAVLAIGAEFGQLFGLVEGTFTFVDVVFYVAGFVLALMIIQFNLKGIQNEKFKLA